MIAMSKHLHSRRQIKLDDERQIFSPDGLEEGMYEGVVGVMEASTLPERTLPAAHAFTVARDSESSRLQAAKSGWELNSERLLIPRWRGIINWCNSDTANVQLTAMADQADDIENLVGVDPMDLPDLEGTPTELYASFSSMGLVAIQAGGHEAGRWERSATLELDERE